MAVKPDDRRTEYLKVPGCQIFLQDQGRLGGVVYPQLQAGPALLTQPRGGDLLQQHAVVDEPIAGGQVGKLAQNMAGDQDGGLPVPVELQEKVPEFHDPLRVQAVDGLVQEQEVRSVHQSQRQAKALLHTQRKMLERLGPGIRQSGRLQRLVHRVPARDAPLNAVILQILPGVQIGVETGGLHHGPGVGAHAGVLPLALGPEEGDLPLGGRGLSRDHPDDGGLSGAVASDQAVDLSPFQVQIDMIRGQRVAIALGKAPGRQYLFCHRGINPSFLIVMPL